MEKPRRRKRKNLFDLWVSGMLSTNEFERRKKELENRWQKK